MDILPVHVHPCSMPSSISPENLSVALQYMGVWCQRKVLNGTSMYNMKCCQHNPRMDGGVWDVMQSLADRIAEIDVFKIYPEEVHTGIPKQMPQQWWVDGPTVTTGLGIQLVTESIKEAMEFFQDMETFFLGAISEKIKELDNQIRTKGQELYHYEDCLMTIEALTESELVLQGNWSDRVKQRDGDRKQVTRQ
ncbi:hypothetical protein EDC04DRAFT_2608161 [Pisolithus marmoratus]|nr:hypothetical protein EDC04DRAFT_2608161 [Pisolithus marmoratus]